METFKLRLPAAFSGSAGDNASFGESGHYRIPRHVKEQTVPIGISIRLPRKEKIKNLDKHSVWRRFGSNGPSSRP
jgi:hypothetical protein